MDNKQYRLIYKAVRAWANSKTKEDLKLLANSYQTTFFLPTIMLPLLEISIAEIYLTNITNEKISLFSSFGHIFNAYITFNRKYRKNEGM